MSRQLFFPIFLLLSSSLYAETEAYYSKQAQSIHGGQLEVRLSDGSRVDLLNDIYAFEVEKAYNWKEAIGQSLHYALMTGNKAGIILIMEGNRAPRHLERLKAVMAEYQLPIEVFVTSKER